jgi:hypothetical protein
MEPPHQKDGGGNGQYEQFVGPCDIRGPKGSAEYQDA